MEQKNLPSPDSILSVIEQEMQENIEFDLTDHYPEANNQILLLSEIQGAEEEGAERKIVFDLPKGEPEPDEQYPQIAQKLPITEVTKIPPMDIVNEVQAAKEQPRRYPKPVFLTPTMKNLPEVISYCRIDPANAPPEPTICLERVEQGGKNSKVLMKGGITVVAGKPKSCKTKFCGMLTAACIDPNVYSGLFQSFFCEYREDVVYVDTEQSRGEATGLYMNIQKILGVSESVSNLIMYSLRQYNYKERLMILDGILGEPDLNIGSLFIDGIRDLVSDPNNAEESNAVVSKLMKWSMEFDISIVVVIHQNKVDSNVRGHLGTELMNKADNVILVERNEYICEVRSVVSRGKNITPFYFKLDDNGTPFVLTDYAAEKQGVGSRDTGSDITPESISMAIHREVLEGVYASFTTGFVPGWSDILKVLQKAFAARSIHVGENKLRTFVAYYLRLEILSKVSVSGRTYCGYQFNRKEA